MAAMATGIWNHAAAQTQTLAGRSATPMADPTGNSSSASSDSATISANDFLTLLVTEMQNQDPTADTDPNEYVDQLVQVNSLQQLISINQSVTGALGTGSSSSDSSGSASDVRNRSNSASGEVAHRGAVAATGTSATQAAATGAPVNAPGNLSIPQSKAAAERVAQSLSG